MSFIYVLLSRVQQNSTFFFNKITNVLQDFQMSLAMTWCFQFIFSVAITSSTYNLPAPENTETD